MKDVVRTTYGLSKRRVRREGGFLGERSRVGGGKGTRYEWKREEGSRKTRMASACLH